MGSEPLRFTIEMDADASPIAGRLRPEGAEIPFVGWIGLARALEQVLCLGSSAAAGEQIRTTQQGGDDEAPTK